MESEYVPTILKTVKVIKIAGGKLTHTFLFVTSRMNINEVKAVKILTMKGLGFIESKHPLYRTLPHTSVSIQSTAFKYLTKVL